MGNVIIGHRQDFAIEVADFKRGEGRVKFWVNNTEVGDLEVFDELETCANSLRNLVTNKEDLYDDAFASKTEAEIFQYCLLLDSNSVNRTDKEYERFRRVQHLSPFWGEQFDCVTKVIYFKNEYYHLLWSYNNDYTADIDYMENFKVERIKVEYFEFACENFVDYVYSQE